MRTLVLPMVLLLAGTALAQVSVNQGALDQLKPSAPARPVPPTRPQKPEKPARPTVKPATKTSAKPDAKPAAREAKPAAASPPKPAKPAKPKPVAVAPAPPPVAVLPPAVEPPRLATTPPAPAIPMLVDAAGEFTPIPGGIRVTFGITSSDLNPNTANALRQVAREVVANPATDLNVFAYATGVPDDPSTPRRLSLSRALAARAVLIGEGIVSTRIYVRALGAAGADGPPDRVDVVRAGTEIKPETKP